MRDWPPVVSHGLGGVAITPLLRRLNPHDVFSSMGSPIAKRRPLQKTRCQRIEIANERCHKKFARFVAERSHGVKNGAAIGNKSCIAASDAADNVMRHRPTGRHPQSDRLDATHRDPEPRR